MPPLRFEAAPAARLGSGPAFAGGEDPEVADLARTYGRRPGAAGELAAVWDEIPADRQEKVLAEIGAGLHGVRAGTAEVVPQDPNHPAMTGSHAHNHSAYGQGDGADHNHQHEHGADGHGDADHDHDHAHPARAGATAGRPGQIANAVSAGAQVYPIRCRIRNEDSGVTRIDIFDFIGGDGWLDEGVTAKSFAAQMAKVKGPLECHVNSGGGEVHDGIAIGNALRSHKGPVTVVVDGIAASIASVIVQAGQERVMQPGSMMMLHEASTMAWGDEAEMAKTAEVLGKNSDNIASIYAERAGGTPEQWREVMKAETWYTADEAVAAGLADRVGDGDAELPAGMDLAAFSAVPGRIAARLRSMPQAKAPAGGQDPVTPRMLREVREALRGIK